MIKVKLNEILESRERNLNWLSKKANLSYSTLYNFANGKTNAVSYILLDSIINVLDCNLTDIMDYTKN